MQYPQLKAESALNRHLSTRFGSDFTIIYDGMPYEPQIEETYIVASHTPGRKMQATLGTSGYNRIEGTFNIAVFYPKLAGYESAYAPLEIAERIVSYFARGTQLIFSGVIVNCLTASRSSMYETDMRYIPVVSVEWYSYVANDTPLIGDVYGFEDTTRRPTVYVYGEEKEPVV